MADDAKKTMKRAAADAPMAPAPEKKRKLRKGKKKSKAERLARVSAAAAQHPTADAASESLDALKALLDDPQSASSKEWDVAQSLALRINTSEVKELVVHRILWMKETPKAAAHYAKRLQLTETSVLRVLLRSTDDAATGEASTSEGALNLLRAKFLCEVSTSMVSNQRRLDAFLWPWLVAQATDKSPSDGNPAISSGSSNVEGDKAAIEAKEVAMNHAMQAHGAAIRLLLLPQQHMKKQSDDTIDRDELQRLLVQECIAKGEFLHFVSMYASAFSSQVNQAMLKADATASTAGEDSLEPEPDAATVHKEQMRRQQVASRLESILQLMWPDARVLVFGSSATGLLHFDPETQHECHDDLDLCVLIPSNPLFRQKAAPLIVEMKEHLSVYLSDCSDLVAIEGARIPIVQFTDPESGLRCDLCVNNVTALWNMQLMKKLLNVCNPLWSSRIRALSLWLKRWRCAKRKLFGSGLSSYGLQLLVIYYFQQRKVLPAFTLSTENGSIETLEELQGFDYEAVDKALEAVQQPQSSKQQEHNEDFSPRTSSWSTLVDFFKFYAMEFDYEDTVVSLRSADVVTKESKTWTRKTWKAAFSIEDPIEVDRDLGTLFNRKTFARLRTAFVHACVIFSHGEANASRNEQTQALLACMSYDLVPQATPTPRKQSVGSEPSSSE